MLCRQTPARQGTHSGLRDLIPGEAVSTGAWTCVHRSPRQVRLVGTGGKKPPRVPKGHGPLHLPACSPGCPNELARTPADLGSWEEARAGPVAGATRRTREPGGAAAGRAKEPRSLADGADGRPEVFNPPHPQMCPGQLFRTNHHPQGTVDSISLSGKTVQKHKVCRA